MKLKNFLLATSLVALAFVSCTNDDDNNPKTDANQVQFTSVIGSLAQPMAAGTQWSANDRIGVFMKASGLPLSAGNIVDGAENIPYVTESGNGTFSPVVPAQAIKMPSDGSAVDFIAYYPYVSPITSYTYPVNVENQTSQEAIDLLYSNQAVGKDKSDANVTLNFKHRLSKVVFNVKAGTGVTSLSGLVTRMSGMKTRADFSLADNSLSLNTSSIKDIVLKNKIDGEIVISEGIILPDSDKGNVKVSFVLPVIGSFSTVLSNDFQFESGKMYTFFVVLKDDGTVVTLNPNGTIEDWTNGTTQDTVLYREEPIGDGTKENPYKIGQLSSKIGEVDKWVEGYIVSIPSYISRSYILLAENATETNVANCAAVELVAGSEIQKCLDIIDNPSLVGKSVKVQGTFATNVAGLAVGIINVIAQSGGICSEIFYFETFGTVNVSSSRPKINAYTGWDEKTVTYSGTGDIRSTSSFDNHAWLPVGDASLKVENINTTNLKSIKLTYSITANVNNVGSTENINKLQIKCDGVNIPVPSYQLNHDDHLRAYYTVTIENLPEGFTTLEFVTTAADNTLGFRLDNVKLEGIR